MAPTDHRGCEPPDALSQHSAFGSSAKGAETKGGRNGGTTPSPPIFTTLFPEEQKPRGTMGNGAERAGNATTCRASGFVGIVVQLFAAPGP